MTQDISRRKTFLFRSWTLFLLLPGLAAAAPLTGSPSRTIALTFDDLPMTVVGNDHIAGPLAETTEIMESLIAQLRTHSATAIGFVNEVKLNVPGQRDARAKLLEEWLDANLLLGNHGYRHLKFSVVGLPTHEEEFIRGDTITAPMLAQRHQNDLFFRPPYMDTGNDKEQRRAFEALLSKHGYRLAPVTVENFDWMFNASYDDACRKHDDALKNKVLQAYLAHTTEEFQHAETLASKLFSRNISQVSLMHANRINADHLSDVLQLLKARGYRYITLAQALGDPAYGTPDEYVGTDLGSWLDRWQIHFGHPIEKRSGPQPPQWIADAYDRIAGQTIGH